MAEVTLTVNGGIHGYVSCPVTARCGKSACAVKQVTLTDAKTGAAVPCQVAPVTGADQVELTWIIDKLAPGEERRYVCKCEDGAPKPATGGVELTQVGEQRVDVKIGGEAFTSYNFSREFARPFLHPLIGPYGKPVTRGFPMLKGVPGETQDHPHHRSFWVAWGDVNGADNWSEQPNHGRMVHQKFNALSSGPVFGQISTTNFWVDKTGQKLLEEDRDIRIYNLPASVRAVDLTVTLRATEGQVRLGDTKEGGICSIRVATSMDAKKGGQIENAYGGVNEKETWGKRASATRRRAASAPSAWPPAWTPRRAARSRTPTAASMRRRLGASARTGATTPARWTATSSASPSSTTPATSATRPTGTCATTA